MTDVDEIWDASERGLGWLEDNGPEDLEPGVPEGPFHRGRGFDGRRQPVPGRQDSRRQASLENRRRVKPERSVCVVCGADIVQAVEGRPRLTCSGACRKRLSRTLSQNSP